MTRFARLHVLALAALAVSVMCMAANAQPQRGGPGGPGGFRGGPGGPGGFMGGPGGGLGGLLMREQVQAELKLEEGQKEQLRAIFQKSMEEMRERFAGFRDLSEEERKAKAAQMREQFENEREEREKKTEKQIAEILKPDQFKRLMQIQVQQQGVAAFGRPDIAQALGLSDDQKGQMQQVIKAMDEKTAAIREESMKLFEGFRELSDEEQAARRKKGEELREKRGEIEKEAQTKVIAILTDDQKAKLPDVMGEPFEFRRPEGRPGEGRPGGEGGRGERRPGEGRRGNRPRENQ